MKLGVFEKNCMLIKRSKIKKCLNFQNMHPQYLTNTGI